MYLYIWYRGTFPRYRFDQLMKVGWKVLLPISLGVLIVTAHRRPVRQSCRCSDGGVAMSLAPLLRKVFLVDLIKGLAVTFRYQEPSESRHRAISAGAADDRGALSRTAAAERNPETGERFASPATCARWPARNS